MTRAPLSTYVEAARKAARSRAHTQRAQEKLYGPGGSVRGSAVTEPVTIASILERIGRAQAGTPTR